MDTSPWYKGPPARKPVGPIDQCRKIERNGIGGCHQNYVHLGAICNLTIRIGNTMNLEELRNNLSSVDRHQDPIVVKIRGKEALVLRVARESYDRLIARTSVSVGNGFLPGNQGITRAARQHKISRC